MSLLKKVVKVAGKLANKAGPVASMIPGPIGVAGRVVTGVATAGAAISGAKAIGGLARSLPALPRVIPGVGKAVKMAGKVASAAATGYFIYDAAGNLIGTRKKHRRLNPMNHRALNRAIRRVCAAKKIAKKIEKLTGSGSRRKAACSPKAKRC